MLCLPLIHGDILFSAGHRAFDCHAHMMVIVTSVEYILKSSQKFEFPCIHEKMCRIKVIRKPQKQYKSTCTSD
jgi:hypothetical protein